MSLDVTKKVKSITYNGTEIPLDDSGSNALLNELRTQLLAVQGELQVKEAELTAQQAIEDSIITATWTDYYNDRVTTVGRYACRYASLTSVHMPKVTVLSYGAFWSAENLSAAIFEKATYMDGAALNAAILDVLVLGAAQVCTMNNKNALANTSIASGTGYVYVRDELVDSYKTATNWSTYAAQIKSISELPAEIRAKLEL